MFHTKTITTIFLCASLASVAACSDDHAHDEHENEVITTVALTFTPMAGGADMVYEFNDADGDGGDPPTIDPIDLTAGDYMLMISFENRLEDPPEDITEEINDEADEHQLFFTGSAVEGPASDNPGAPLMQAYDDQDAGGLPIGLANTITAIAGTGDLTVTLRHMPPVNDQPVKAADTADLVAAEGFGSIGGNNDAQVTLPVTVQ